MTLIERIEQAEGPSLELDAEIARAVGWTYRKRDGFNVFQWYSPGSSDKPFENFGISSLPPGFSSSIDAALTLVPTEPFPGLRPGTWWWMVDNLGCDAHVAYENHDSGIPEYGARAATPALAICAAALKARGQ